MATDPAAANLSTWFWFYLHAEYKFCRDRKISGEGLGSREFAPERTMYETKNPMETSQGWIIPHRKTARSDKSKPEERPLRLQPATVA